MAPIAPEIFSRCPSIAEMGRSGHSNDTARQFSICQEDGRLFVLERDVNPENLIPRTAEHAVAPDEDSRRVRIVVSGVPISLILGVRFF